MIKNTDTTNDAQANGSNTFQPNAISWSYLKRGNVARTQMKTNITNHNFKQYHIKPGIKLIKSAKTKWANGIGNQPPKKMITNKLDITITCKYSPKKRNAKVIEAYSTLKPGTNSDSASAKSNGALYVSASAHINQIIAKGPLININHKLLISCCAKTTAVTFKLPTNKNTCNNISDTTSS